MATVRRIAGKSGWWWDYVDPLDGRRRRERAPTASRSEARKLLDLLLVSRTRMKLLGLKPVEEVSFGALWRRFQEERLPRLTASPRRSYSDAVTRFLLPRWGALPAHQIGAVELEKVASDLRAREKPLRFSSIGLVLRIARAVLSAGRDWSFVREVHPLPRLPQEQPPFRFLNEREGEALLLAAREGAPWAFPLILAALHLGARRGELLGLRWADVDFERGRVTIARGGDGERTKGGRARVVPLTPILARALQDWRAVLAPDAEAVFPGVDETKLRRAFEAARARSGIGPCRFHDLRHTALSALALRAGAGTVRALAGHAGLGTTSRYVHADETALRSAAEALTYGKGLVSA